jgi:hypothetical protein
MTKMRAKMQIQKIEQLGGYGSTGVTSETLHLVAVSRNGSYPADGSDEDNTYAKFSPFGELKLQVANPALIGQFKPGEKYYLDFTKAEN